MLPVLATLQHLYLFPFGNIIWISVVRQQFIPVREYLDHTGCFKVIYSRTGISCAVIHSPGSAKRFIDRRRERGEQLRPFVGHVQAVLETDAELAKDVEAGFVGEAHAG